MRGLPNFSFTFFVHRLRIILIDTAKIYKMDESWFIHFVHFGLLASNHLSFILVQQGSLIVSE